MTRLRQRRAAFRDLRRPSGSCAAATIAAVAAAELAAGRLRRMRERWLYCSVNLQVDRSVDDLTALFDRAKRSGYTGILLADYKFQVLYRVPDNYFRNVEKVKAAAAKAGLELIPAVFSIGYSNGHLAQDPNLAEGLPVVDQPYRRQEPRSSRPRERAIAAGGPSRAAAASRPCSTPNRPPSSRTAASKRASGDQFLRLLVPGRPGRRRPSPTARSSIGGRVSCRLEPGYDGPRHVRRPTSACPARHRPAPHRLPLLVLGQDARPRADRLVPLAGARHRPGRPAAHVPRRGPRADAGLEADRGRLQQPGPDARSTSTPASGAREKAPSGSTTWRSRSWLWSTSCAATGCPLVGQVGRRQDHLRGRPRLRAGRRPQARHRFPGRANSTSTIQAPPSGSRPARGSRTATGCA